MPVGSRRHQTRHQKYGGAVNGLCLVSASLKASHHNLHHGSSIDELMAMNDRFLPWLPGSESTAPIIADDLELLLSSEPDELWGLVRSDASLSVLLTTFLRYAR